MKPFDFSNHPSLAILLVVLAVWELIWKGLALWRAARQNQSGWYLAILILNTVGILPIIYLLLHKEPPTDEPSPAPTQQPSHDD